MLSVSHFERVALSVSDERAAIDRARRLMSQYGTADARRVLSSETRADLTAYESLNLSIGAPGRAELAKRIRGAILVNELLTDQGRMITRERVVDDLVTLALADQQQPSADDPAAVLRWHLMAALLEVALEHKQQGDTDGGDGILDEIADLGSDAGLEELQSLLARFQKQPGGAPEDVQQLAFALEGVEWLAWQAKGQTRSGKTRWKNTDTGEWRYQISEPGHRERRRSLAGVAQKHLTAVRNYEDVTADHLAEMADHLPHLTVDELRRVRGWMGAQAVRGGRLKQGLIDAIKAYAEKMVERAEQRGKDYDEEQEAAKTPKEVEPVVDQELPADESASEEPTSSEAVESPEEPAPSDADSVDEEMISSARESDKKFQGDGRYEAETWMRMKEKKPSAVLPKLSKAAAEYAADEYERDGKPIPPEVLADYPDLAEQYAPKNQPSVVDSTSDEPSDTLPETTTPTAEPEHARADEQPQQLEPATPSGERNARHADGGSGQYSGGGDAGNDRGSGREPVRPRIVTARAEFTKAGNPELVPAVLRPHLNESQQQGAALAIDAIQNHGGFLLADGTGAGKTRQMLAVGQAFLDQGKKVVVVAPAEVIKPDWKKGTMTGTWAEDGAKMGVPTSLTKGDGPLVAGKINVTSYNELGKLKGQIDKDTILIYDEAHAMKNRTSARYKHGKEASDKAAGVLYATATQADKPLHIAYLARAGVFGNVGVSQTYEKLGMEVVEQRVHGGGTVKVWRVDPSVGYKECARRISGLFDQLTKDGLMIRRELSMEGTTFGTDHIELTEDQNKELKNVYESVLRSTGGDAAVKRSQLSDQLWAAKDKLRNLSEDLRGIKEGNAGYSAKDLPAVNEQIQAARALVAEIQNKIDSLPQSSGGKEGNRAIALMAARLHQEPMKIPMAVQAIREELAAGRSPVLFLGRVNDIGADPDEEDDVVDKALAGSGYASEGTAKALKRALIEAGVPEADIAELHGGATTTPAAKKKAMEAFQSNKAKVMIATVQSGGTGINLDDTTGDRPRTMIMMTPPFTANDMAQAVGRIHRTSTKSKAKIRGLLANTNIDRWNAGVLAKKFELLGAATGGRIEQAQEAIGQDVPKELQDDESQPFVWGESLIRVPKHYHNTPFSHNETIKQFGGRRVMRDGQWTTEFPSREHFEKYRQATAPPPQPAATTPTVPAPAPQPAAVAPTPPAPPPAAAVPTPPPKPKYETRKVSTSRGERHAYSFRPDNKFWDMWRKDKERLKSKYGLSMDKDQRGDWRVTLWGATPEEVARNADALKSVGVYLSLVDSIGVDYELAMTV